MTIQRKAPANVTPKFKVIVAGQEVQQGETEGLVYLSIEDHVDMIGVAQVSFNIGGMKWSGFKHGDEIEVQIGKSSRKMFQGVITSLRHSWAKGNETITVVAMDPLIKMGASRVTQVYNDQKDSDVVSAVISRAGCKPGTIDTTQGTHKYIFQRNESDYNFIKRLAARNGFLVKANEGKIDFVKSQFSASPVEIDQEFLMSLDYSMEPMNIPPEITVIGWDYLTKKKVEATAKAGDVANIGGGQSAVSNNGQIWSQPSYVSDVLVSSQDGAKDMAVSELNRLARRFLRGRAVIQGNSDVHAGGKITFKGMTTGFNPEVYVVSARHVVEPTRGFSTEINYCGNTLPK